MQAQARSSQSAATSTSGGGSGGGGNSGGGSSGSGSPAASSSGFRRRLQRAGRVLPRRACRASRRSHSRECPIATLTSSPGVGFDCSGLTAYAWGQAGVGLPHQSGAQFGSVPRVAIDQAQPGDLLFFYSPISHVSIYLGNGMQVHAPNTGKTVTVAAVNWGKVVGVGRPG